MTEALSYRNQSIDLQSNGLRPERVKAGLTLNICMMQLREEYTVKIFFHEILIWFTKLFFQLSQNSSVKSFYLSKAKNFIQWKPFSKATASRVINFIVLIP